MTFDRFTSRGMAAVRFVAQRGLLKPLVWCLVRVQTQGQGEVAQLRAPFVVVANHSSHLDAPLILGWLPRHHTRYLAAGAAADYFFDIAWRKWLTTLFFNAFAVERNAEGKRAGASRSLIERGVPLLLFPEGGRSASGAMGRFKTGPAALAIATGAPCVPVALVGASAAMPRGRNWPRPGRLPVHVVIGAPMLASRGESAEEFARRLEAEVRRLHETVQPMPARPEHAEKGTR